MYRPNLRGRGTGGIGISKAKSVLSRASTQLKGGQPMFAKDENDDDIGVMLLDCFVESSRTNNASLLLDVYTNVRACVLACVCGASADGRCIVHYT